ncbi:hypothetical protein Tco_0931776 [Tanacetum coccineum]
MYVAQVAQPQVNPDSAIAQCVQELYTIQRSIQRYPLDDIQRIYELFVKCRGHRYRGRGYDRRHEAEQKQVEIMEDRRDKVHAEYHVLEMQPQGLLSELVIWLRIVLADDNTLDIAGIRDVVLKTSFGTS